MSHPFISDHLGSTSPVFLSLCFEISHVGRFWQCVVKNTSNACVEWTIPCQTWGEAAMRLLRDLNYPTHVHTHFPRINEKCIGKLKRTVSNLCTTCSQTVSAWKQQANSDPPSPPASPRPPPPPPLQVAQASVHVHRTMSITQTPPEPDVWCTFLKVTL